MEGRTGEELAERIAWASERLAAAGIESPRFEAQLLLALALGVPRAAILARTAPEPTEAQQREFERFVCERSLRVPLAYLRGTQEFYGLVFQVTPATLIPRPETELLVDFARKYLRQFQQKACTSSHNSAIFIADIGTGSGCLAVSIVKENPGVRALATDFSAEALRVAERNAIFHAVCDSVRFVQTSLLTGIGSGLSLVLSNPPYIPAAELPTLQPEVSQYEPRGALDGGADGLRFYRALTRDAQRALCPEGWLAVEVGQGQAQAVAALFQAEGYANVGTERDLAGIERIVFGQKADGGK